MDDFSKVEVGDKLWSPLFGWGKVVEKEESEIEILSETLKVSYSFDMQGKLLGYPDYPQLLFFEEMILSPKPKPEEIKPFDPNKPYQRRDEKVCEIIKKLKQNKYAVATLSDDGKYEIIYETHLDGRQSGSGKSKYDLVNIPEVIEGWVNVYDDAIVTIHSQGDGIHASREIADKIAGGKRIACKFISVVKGEGLND